MKAPQKVNVLPNSSTTIPGHPLLRLLTRARQRGIRLEKLVLSRSASTPWCRGPIVLIVIIIVVLVVRALPESSTSARHVHEDDVILPGVVGVFLQVSLEGRVLVGVLKRLGFLVVEGDVGLGKREGQGGTDKVWLSVAFFFKLIYLMITWNVDGDKAHRERQTYR